MGIKIYVYHQYMALRHFDISISEAGFQGIKKLYFSQLALAGQKLSESGSGT